MNPAEHFYLTPRMAAERLQVSLSTVRAMIRDRRLPARRLRGSRLIRIAVEDVDRTLEPVEMRTPAAARPPLRAVR